MKELDEILTAYKVARNNGESCLLATLVKVEGSSYRRVGARMLLSSGGRRCGTMSGGCLEAEIQKKAWWLTEKGPVVRQYRTTTEEETGVPLGLGCNGTLSILLKRLGDDDSMMLQQLEKQRKERVFSSLAVVLTGADVGMQRLFPGSGHTHVSLLENETVDALLRRAAEQATSEYVNVDGAELFIEALPPRPRLVILGAGDDAKPLVRLACLLGWDVAVADGRAHLATVSRFPEATEVLSASVEKLADLCGIREDDAVVIMTHSFEQDCSLLATLLGRPLRYLGLLGPRYRTKRLISGIPGAATFPEGLSRLHSPIGLDIGAHTPETIALAIIAEVQSVFSKLETQPINSTTDSQNEIALT